LTENGVKKILDFDPGQNTYVPRGAEDSEFIAMLKALSKTREKGNAILWDGKDAQGQRTGGPGLQIKSYDQPIAAPFLTAELVKAKIIQPPKIL
jgi:nucleoid-associated protein YgaU